MLVFLFLFSLALGAMSSLDGPQAKQQRSVCRPLWYKFRGRCYKYISTRLTWADAELYCVLQGANLVSIHSLEEDEFVRTLIKNFDHAERRTWIGLSDIHKEGKWMWSNGCAAKFYFWAGTEPNNLGENEHCAHNNFKRGRKWNDEKCDLLFPSVCASHIDCP